MQDTKNAEEVITGRKSAEADEPRKKTTFTRPSPYYHRRNNVKEIHQ
jgi:hypothetical protein